MSADFINSLGARSPQLRDASAPGARPTPPLVPSEGPTPGQESTPAAPTEAFAPTAEASETPQDRQAGEAQASQIFSAWAPSAPPTASASTGSLSIQGAENTSFQGVHAANHDGYAGDQGTEAGFSGGTVFSSRPPA